MPPRSVASPLLKLFSTVVVIPFAPRLFFTVRVPFSMEYSALSLFTVNTSFSPFLAMRNMLPVYSTSKVAIVPEIGA